MVGTDNLGKTNNIAPLPTQYSEVPPVQQWREDPPFPVSSAKAENFELLADVTLEYGWLNHVKDVLEDDEPIKDQCVSWAAFHSSKMESTEEIPPDISCLLPLFQEEAKSVAMILHAMNTVKCSVNFLNHGQIPVLACDQPLYSIAKQIQWHWTQTHGEQKYVVILGGLHVEMAAWRAVGDLLEASGWTSAITQANIASSGMADLFLKASHISRTRHAHQVTACGLHILMCSAYADYINGMAESDVKLDFDKWKKAKARDCPQFKYWSLILKVELIVLMFVHSLREGSFSLYEESIRQLLPFFFALDKYNYSRWLTVHLHDMTQLDKTCPTVHQMFEQGLFVVRKTQRKFSALAIDHAHEQNNKLVKGNVQQKTFV